MQHDLVRGAWLLHSDNSHLALVLVLFDPLSLPSGHPQQLFEALAGVATDAAPHGGFTVRLGLGLGLGLWLGLGLEEVFVFDSESEIRARVRARVRARARVLTARLPHLTLRAALPAKSSKLVRERISSEPYIG